MMTRAINVLYTVLATAVPALAAEYEPLRTSEFLKLNVITNDDQKIGQVQDFAVDLDDGRIVYVVLKKGNDWTAVPFGALKLSDDRTLVLQTAQSRFDNAPKFDNNQWKTIGDRRWGEIVHKHYGLEDRWDDSTSNSDPAPLVQGSKLRDLEIENKQQRDLGEIEDFVINASDGEIAYSVLTPDSSLEMGGNKLLPVPWEAVSVKGNGDGLADRKLVVDKGAGEFRSAPTFNQNDWPRLADRAWNKQVTEFYGVRPDWVYASDKPGGASDKPGGGGGGNNKPQPGKQDLTGWQADGQYVKLYDPKTVETIRGTIVDYDQFKTRPDGAPGQLVKVRTEDNKEYVVHLGPVWFIQEHDLRWEKGKEIRVTGSKVNYEGQPVIMASEIKHADRTVTIRNEKGEPRWVR
jgi:sporulation protein YlmC with PRC-barrel domain